VRIALVHHFHSQVRSVHYVRPGIDNPALRVHNAAIEVEAVQVELLLKDAYWKIKRPK
jgi:hypothetical protein